MHLVLLYCYRCLAFYLSYLTKLHLPELARLPTPPDILIHPFQRGTLPPALLRSAGLRVVSWFLYIHKLWGRVFLSSSSSSSRRRIATCPTCHALS